MRHVHGKARLLPTVNILYARLTECFTFQKSKHQKGPFIHHPAGEDVAEGVFAVRASGLCVSGVAVPSRVGEVVPWAGEVSCTRGVRTGLSGDSSARLSSRHAVCLLR